MMNLGPISLFREQVAFTLVLASRERNPSLQNTVSCMPFHLMPPLNEGTFVMKWASGSCTMAEYSINYYFQTEKKGTEKGNGYHILFSSLVPVPQPS